MTHSISSPLSTHILFKQIRRHPTTTVVVAIGAIGLIALATTKKFIFHQIKWQDLTLRNLFLAFINRFGGSKTEDVRTRLINLSNQHLEQSNQKFELAGRKYIAYVPENYRGESTNLKDYHSEILEKSEAPIIVNLVMEHETDYLPADNDDKKREQDFGFKSLSIKKQYFKLLGNFSLLQIPKDKEINLIKLADEINKPYRKNETVFVHCLNGLETTATFISILALISDEKFKKSNPSDEELLKKMISNLEFLALTARGRVPNQHQIALLLNPEFLRKIVNYTV